jgi:hypothetical protein
MFKGWHLEDQLYIARVQGEDVRNSYRQRTIELAEQQNQNDALTKEIRRLRGGQRKESEETNTKSKKKNKDKSDSPKPHPLEL